MRQSGHLGFLNYACDVAQVQCVGLAEYLISAQTGHESLSHSTSRTGHALYSTFVFL